MNRRIESSLRQKAENLRSFVAGEYQTGQAAEIPTAIPALLARAGFQNAHRKVRQQNARLNRRLTQLRDGTTPKYAADHPPTKPLVVSMGNLAASGGYYIAMPAKKTKADEIKLFAEPTTIRVGLYVSRISSRLA